MHSKIAYDNHKMNIIQLTMSSRNESAKMVSCLSDRMARVSNKIDAALINSNGIHGMMRYVIGELKNLIEQNCDDSLIENNSVQSASSLSSSSGDSS